MASTVLPNGIIIPEKFSRDWYNDLYHNWQELDNLLGGGTPKDGTLTIQKNGDTVGTFSANQATNETINITVPDVNDATLTIQRNGTTVDTFTANSSTDKTVDITVPTKTSDLTNDSGFITEDTTKIPLAGSNAISGSLIPATDNSIDIGSSTKNIKMLYTKGITIDGTQFLPSNYMTLNTIQTVTSTKNYSGYQNINAYRLRIKSSDQEKGVIPASNQWNGFTFNDKNDETMFSIEQGVLLDGTIQLKFSGRANDNDTTLTTFLRYTNSSDLTTNCVNVIDLIPFGNGTRKLGDTNAKWKSFNGINPGALSLPSSTYISLDTTNFDVTANIIGTFTPTVDGWAILSMSQKNKHFGIWIIGGTHRVTFHSVYHNSDYMIFALMPVRANVAMNIYCTADDIDSTRKIDWLRLFPCQGNV